VFIKLSQKATQRMSIECHMYTGTVTGNSGQNRKYRTTVSVHKFDSYAHMFMFKVLFSR